MTITSYPFDNQDVTETQFSAFFKELQDSGVVGEVGGSGFLLSTDGSGLDVQVSPGMGIVRGHVVNSDASVTKVLAAADATNPRRDRVVLRLDPVANAITIEVLTGVPAASPVVPACTFTETGIFEVSLGEVYVPAAALNVATSNLSDNRTFIGQRVGQWTTATRPTSPRKARLGLNADTGKWEFWNGTVWTDLVTIPPVETLAGYRETRTTTGSSGTVTLDLDLYNVFDITPTAAITLALSNASASDTFTPLTIRFNNSTHAVTWPAGTKFASGEAPALSGVTWVSGVVDTAGVLTVGASWKDVA